jgi:DNA excision repair protein ERCC-2
MSTDMAISLSKKFIRQISQPFDHTQTGISLWTLEDIEAKQERDRVEMERAQKEYGEAFGTARTPALAMEGYEPMEMDPDLDGDAEMEAMAAREREELPPANGARAVDADMDYGEIDDDALAAMAETDGF